MQNVFFIIFLPENIRFVRTYSCSEFAVLAKDGFRRQAAIPAGRPGSGSRGNGIPGRENGGKVCIMDRGGIVQEGAAASLDDPAVRRHLTV